MFRNCPTVLIHALALICGLANVIAAQMDFPSTAVPNPICLDAKMDFEQLRKEPAADIDGHIIPMEDVIFSCLRLDRTYVIDQMIQKYVLHRECIKRGIVVRELEIDQRVSELRTNLAPVTLEETLKEHHTTMDDVRNSFRHEMEQTAFVADRIKSCKMLHCQQIVIRFGSDENTDSATIVRTKSEALTLANDVRGQLRQGKDFSDLAVRYSEGSGANDKSDLGIIYENMLGLVEVPVLKTALALQKGEISDPVETDSGYHIIRALSSGDDHSPEEDALYREADKTSRKLQIQFLGPAAVVELINQSTITHLKDSDLIPGMPLPDAAAVVDGYVIPLKDVLAKTLPATGRKRLDILIQNYVVNRECERRGILVSDVEIDERVAALRKQIAPMTIEEGLTQHHTTMEGLRRDFQQEIQRTKLVINDVQPTKCAHARVIFVRTDSTESPESKSFPHRADVDAKALITDIQRILKAGKAFPDLAKQYSEISQTNHDGDLGILYEGKRDVDTAILRTALAMAKGEISPSPVRTYGGYFLLEVVSTSDSHPSGEDSAYDQANSVYRQEKAQSLVRQAILDLIKKSKVTYYLPS